MVYESEIKVPKFGGNDESYTERSLFN